jgi:hypothetical protein
MGEVTLRQRENRPGRARLALARLKFAGHRS